MLFTTIAIIITGLVLLEWIRPARRLRQVTYFISSGLVFILIAFNRMMRL
jgi:hypothetical protein